MPSLVHDVLRSPGQPLDAGTRGHMESRFAHDFSRVRVHTDARAAQSAQSVAARAYTVGNHIVFNHAAYDPRSRGGQQLLAHELTHTVQQAGTPSSPAPSLEIGPVNSPHEMEADRVADAVVSGATVPRIGSSGAAIARKAKKPVPFSRPRCGPQREAARKKAGTLAVTGFDGTAAGPHISSIDVVINANADSTVTLTWANLPAGVAPPTSFRGSPGAGKCRFKNPDTKKMQDLDCSDPTQSTWKDSLCTPIGPHLVEGFACSIGGPARMVTWFHKKREIAFHYYDDVPNHPASHGCVRLDPLQEGAEWIYDNSVEKVTKVNVARASGNPGPKCYSGKKLEDRPGYVDPTAPKPAPDATQEPAGDGP